MALFPPNIRLSSRTASKLAGAGWSVASASDVNGDGFADVIVGNTHSGVGFSEGLSYVVFGKAKGLGAKLELSGLDGSSGFRLVGAAGEYSGFSVASGDVNGDGFTDLIIGRGYGDGAWGPPSGVSVVFGKEAGFAPDLDLLSLDGSDGFRLIVSNSSPRVVSAGDVNGDGFADVIVGGTYVVFGKATVPAASIALSTLDGSNGFKLSGVGGWGILGFPVASAGDVNGDGFADLIAGDPGADFPNGGGASYVVFGKASGFSTNLDVSTLNGSNGFRLRGGAAYLLSGYSVASAGDVNGDSFADLIVGAPGANPHGFGEGASYVVFGKASGFSANLDLTSLNGSNGFKLSGGVEWADSGFSVASAGDVNGDGFADLLVGAPYNNNIPADSIVRSASYVVFGKASGFAANLELSSLNGSNGFKLSGNAVLDRSGFSVASAGDVNGDGFADVIVGAPGFDRSGASYVIYGRAPDTPINRTGTVASQTLAGGAFDDTLSGLGGNDLLVGNGGNDTLDGGDGLDTASYARARGAVTVALIAGAQDTKAAGTDSLANIENLTGSAFNDKLSGNAAANVLSGGIGNDVLAGGGGDDTLNGGAGNDTLSGGAGNDTLHGGTGSDTASYAEATAGVTVNLTAAGAQNTGSAGNDLLDGIENLEGTSFDDELTGDAGANALSGGAGSDTLSGGAGNDTLHGGTGTDTAIYAEAGAGVTVSLAIGAQNTVGEGIDTLISIEKLVGSSFDDALTGNAEANTISGGTGNDMLSGGDGNDKLDGGSGADTAIFASAASSVAVSLAISSLQNTGGAGKDTLTGIENLIGSSFDDVLTGDAGANVLIGGKGNDTLVGGVGDDTLVAGFGRDLLDGGAGADIFDFDHINEIGNTAAARDQIQGFAQGSDRIDLTTIDANTLLADDQAFAFIGAAAFTGVAGQLRSVAGAETIVRGDINGDGTADFQIQLNGNYMMTAGDFVL